MKLLQTTEAWIGLLIVLIMGVKTTFAPDLPLTEETVTGLVVWVVARLAKKGITKIQNGGTQ